MPLAILQRLRHWKPVAKTVVLGLVKVAAGAAAANPEYALLGRCLGAAGEAVAESALDALLPDEQADIDHRLATLLDAHADLIQRLEAQAAASDEDAADVIRRSLAADAELQRQFDAFAADLDRVAGTLRRIESKVDAVAADVRWIRGRLEEFDARNHVRANTGRRQYQISIHTEAELRLLQEVLDRLRQLTPEQQRQIDLGLLGEVLKQAGQFQKAAEMFARAAEREQRQERAGLRYREFLARLEQRDWEQAKQAVAEVLALDDANEYAPFPKHRYELRGVLGAGGFGTAFDCQDTIRDRRVVIKALHAADLSRPVKEVFAEAHMLEQLSRAHPAIIAVRDCDFADTARRRRPYIVMDYFDGKPLQALLDRLPEESGAALPKFLPIARQIAAGLHAAHAAGVIHRDLKPDNVLVGRGADGPEVRLIDFGLAMRLDVVRASQLSYRKSLLGFAAAGTAQYAPPEQMGELAESVGPYSDVYSFGKLCCAALFRDLEPKRRHWQSLPNHLAEMLEKCIERRPKDRHQSFEPILAALRPPAASPPLVPATPTLPPASAPFPALSAKPGGVEAENSAPAVIAEREPARVRPGLTPEQARQLQREWADFLGRPVTEKINLGRGVLLEMNLIPPGSFRMGGMYGGKKVEISKPFWLGIGPVTQAQYETVTGRNPSHFTEKKGGGPSHPVEMVSWNDAMAFCERLTNKIASSGRLFRLPSEAEWEYACRGGADSTHHFGIGDGLALTSNQANFNGNYPFGDAAKGPFLERTTPIGLYRLANGFGLLDMHGNVWEWCENLYSQDDSTRVIRGGSWSNYGQFCLAEDRNWLAPDYRNNSLGFRLAASPSR